MRALALPLYLLMTMQTALALDARELAVCSTEKDSVKRLACFDGLATKAGVDSAKTEAAPSKGKWDVQVNTSPVDDSKTVILRLDGENSVSQRYTTTTPTLILRCQEKHTEAYITFGFFLGSDSTEVTHRLDKQKAEEREWGISTDHQAMFAPKPIDFIRKLLKAETLFLRVTPYGESPVSVSFNLTGLAESIKPLQDACGWKAA